MNNTGGTMSRHDNIINRERVATRVTVRTVKKGEGIGSPGEDMSAEKFTWLNRTACAELTIGHFFVEAGHAISEDVLNVCRGCPVRRECLEHAYSMGIGGGYFGGMSPGQRRNLNIAQARKFIEGDPVRKLR
jgi:WhiB family redox-sensing transcriptional regulator